MKYETFRVSEYMTNVLTYYSLEAKKERTNCTEHQLLEDPISWHELEQ